ncbi:MAG: hypothetical protein ABSC20_08190 [Candidatus Bathyarchaeia archaeon]|jgi:hypothetical protein
MTNEIAKFPSCVREFMAELSGYIKADTTVDKYLKTSDPVSIKDGIVRINIKHEVAESAANYNQFIKDFKAAKQKYHALSSYTDTVVHVKPVPIEETTVKFMPNYYMQGVHIEILLKDLVLDKLGYFFNPDSELSIPDSIQILRNCGMSDMVIMRSLGSPRTTFNRYCKILDSKGAMGETKMDTKETKEDTAKTILDTSQTEQKTELTTVPN